MKAKKQKHNQNQEIPITSLSKKVKLYGLHETSVKKVVGKFLQNDNCLVEGNGIEFELEHMEHDLVKYLEQSISRRIQIRRWNHLHSLRVADNHLNPYAVEWEDPYLCQNTFDKLISTVTLSFNRLRRFGFDCLKEIDSKGLEVIAVKISRNLSGLRKLHLAFSAQEELADQGLEVLAKEISRNFSRLTELSLNLSPNDRSWRSTFTDKGLRIMSSEISRHLTQLETLNIEFPDQMKISSEGIVHFAAIISRRLTKLQVFSFTFSGQQVDEQSLRTILHTISTNLTGLQKLKFSLEFTDDISVSLVQVILTEVCQHLTNLTHLSFDFANQNEEIVELNVNEEDFSVQLNSLRVLELNLGGIATSQKLLSVIISRIICTFPNLQQLIVRFRRGDDGITNRSLETLLFETSLSLANLQTLNINLYQLELNKDKWGIDLNSWTQKPLVSLKNLEIYSALTDKIDDDCLEGLGMRIAFFLTSLETIKLYVAFHSVSDEGLIRFGTPISQSLVNLKRVRISSYLPDLHIY